jgi:deoxyribodipyrimidine photolyase-related protein
MDTHRDFFLKNPRLSMLVHSFDKMDIAKKEHHLKNANQYLAQLDALLK